MKFYFFPSTRERWSFLHTIEESTLPQTHQSLQPLAVGVGKVEVDILSPTPVLETSARLAIASQASPFLPLKSTPLIMHLTVNDRTNLGESGSQCVLTMALAGEKSVICLLEGAKA